MDDIACPIVVHCHHCRSKKLRINLSFKTLRYSSKASLPTAFVFVQSKVVCSYHSCLMQEYCDDAYRAHEAHGEKVDAPYVARHGAVVGELAVYETARNNPS